MQLGSYFGEQAMATQTIPFGARNNEGGIEAYFEGDIDEIKLWNRELSAVEIQSIYQNP